jgi:hypothetical protein
MDGAILNDGWPRAMADDAFATVAGAVCFFVDVDPPCATAAPAWPPCFTCAFALVLCPAAAAALPAALMVLTTAGEDFFEVAPPLQALAMAATPVGPLGLAVLFAEVAATPEAPLPTLAPADATDLLDLV